MDNIPTKKELDTKAKETHDLWLAVLEAKRVAVRCENEFKEMKHKFYCRRVK